VPLPRDIVFVGEDRTGSRSPQRVRTIRGLGIEVDFIRSHPEDEKYETPPSLSKRIRYRLRRPADTAGVNAALLSRLGSRPPPDVLWIDYVLTIRPATFSQLRATWPKTKFVWYSEDDMMRPRNSSVWLEASIGFFDLWLTTKSFNARPEEVPARGARQVMFVDNTYDETTHRKPRLSDDDKLRFGSQVSFVGTYEADRARSIAALGRAQIPVRVWGNGWPAGGAMKGVQVERQPVYGDSLAKVYAASAINLAFLRKANRDLQTCRTIEIPACGGFMLHERTAEAAAILAEGREAAYFASDDELISECRHWLDRPDERSAIAEAGRQRVHSDDRSHRHLLMRTFESLGIAC
jgi:spore maturation protein CgeB